MKSGVSCSLFCRLAEQGLDVLVLELLLGFTVALRSRVVLIREEAVLLLCKWCNVEVVGRCSVLTECV